MTKLSFEDRVYRLGTGYGPGALPQGRGAPPPPSPSTVLFDWDPSVDLYRDRVGGIEFTVGAGTPTLAVAHGQPCAQFNGGSHLVSTEAPFAALSDLTGGCTIYVVSERTDAGAAGSAACFSIDDSTEVTTSLDCLGWYHVSTNDALVAMSGDDAAGETAVASFGNRNMITCNAMTATTALIGQYVDRRLAASTVPAVTPHDPSGLDRCVIGATGLFGSAIVGYWTGNVFRILVCEGGYDQDIQDYLMNTYAPVRMPPGITADDAVFLYDARNAPERDRTNGINLTPTSFPRQTAALGDVCVDFDGTDDELTGSIALGTMSGNWTLYLVSSPDAVASGYPCNFEDAGNEANQHFGGGTNGNDTLGSFTSRRNSNVQIDTAFSGGPGMELGGLYVSSHEMTDTDVQAWTNKASESGATAGTYVPTGIDQVTLGCGFTSFFFDGKLFYALLVNDVRDAAIDDWLADVFQASRPWLPSAVTEADVLEVFDPNYSIDRVWKPIDGEDENLFTSGTVVADTDAAGLGLARFGPLASSVYHFDPAILKLSDHDQITCYMVGSQGGGGGTPYSIYSHYYSSVSTEGLNGVQRSGAGLAAGATAFAGSVFLAQDYSGETATDDERNLATAEFDNVNRTVEAWTNQTSSGSTAISAGDPGSANNFTVSAIIHYDTTSDSTVSYALWVNGPRDPAIEAELEARFPSGEDMS